MMDAIVWQIFETTMGIYMVIWLTCSYIGLLGWADYCFKRSPPMDCCESLTWLFLMVFACMFWPAAIGVLIYKKLRG